MFNRLPHDSGYQPRSQFNQASGFTLIEIVVALSVLAAGMAGVAQLNKTAVETARITFEMQEVTQLASTHINTLDLNPNIEIGSFAGQYSSSRADYNYSWVLVVSPLTVDSMPSGLSELSDTVVAVQVFLTVRYDQGERNVEFHTVLIKAADNGQARHPFNQHDERSLVLSRFRASASEG